MDPSSPLRILFLIAEADPLIKIGGLGDVGGSLPVALRRLNAALHEEDAPSIPAIDIRVVLPFYGAIDPSRYNIQPVADFQVLHTSGSIVAQAFSLKVKNVPFYLISGNPIHPQAPIYSSDRGYDAHKFIFFSIASLELARQLNWQPQVVHANDWHTAPAIYWLSLHRGHDAFFQDTSTLQSVHNLPFLGEGAGFPMGSFYLPPAPISELPDWARHLPLPLSLLTADRINTVSPTYAREILTPEYGSGLESLLARRKTDISGILNGLDQQLWNPEDDPFIPVTYTRGNLFVREANKAALLNELDFVAEETMDYNSSPLLAIISRMDYQKGIDLAIASLRELANRDACNWRLIILGTGLPDLEVSARLLQQQYPDRVRVVTRFNAPLSHRIYAGADILLMPSRYEPCGLSQMIAMRYGCVPVARATGGLRDTVIDYTTSPESTGFLFSDPTPEALFHALQCALAVYQNRPAWQELQRRGMQMDFSWYHSAREYQKLYHSLTLSRPMKKVSKTKSNRKDSS